MAKLKLYPIEKPNRIKSYCKREWKSLAAVIISGTIFNACMSIGPILQGKLIDSIVNKSALKNIIIQACIFILSVFVIQIFRYVKRYYVRLFANRTSASMRMMIYNNIINRDIVTLSKEETGDLMTKAVADVDICVEGIRKVITEIFDTGVLMAGYVVSMFLFSVKISIAACLFIPVAMYLAQRLKNIIVKYSRDARAQSSIVANLTYSNVEHVALFRVNGVEEDYRNKYFKQLDILEKKSVKANIFENSMQPIYNVIALFGIVFILYFGGKNVINGSWSVGTFTAYITIFIALTTKASKAAKLFNSYQKAKVSWIRIKPYMKHYIYKDLSDRKTESSDTFLNVSNLSFTYPESSEPIISNVSFSSKIGQIIGITGPVACGKSTLGSALCGIYPYEGSILINNIQLRDYSDFERSSRISYMGHSANLMSDTIYNNITLGEDGDISNVLHDVCFEEDLKTMDDGINTLVGNAGVKLSGGQQARIALARALYRKSRLVILDDPFSAVDMNTENKIIENIRNNYKDRTIIIISHRLSIFPQTDYIIMLHSDRSAEYGTHVELFNKSNEYREIYELQQGGKDNEK